MVVYRMRQTLPLVTALRKRHFAFLFVVNQVSCAAAEMSTKVSDSSINHNGLVLYQNQFSFYSQKVVMALHEKKLKFDKKFIDLTKNEQYESSFLHINPKGEVPVLQDNVRIIPDSNRIIDYLEDNFSNGDSPRLIPMDSATRQQATYFRNSIDKLPANVITMGTMFHPELVQNSKFPFIGFIRTILANADRDSAKNLRKFAEANPEAKEMLLAKADAQEKKHLLVTNKEEFLKLLDQVEVVLSEVEEELARHTGDKENWWLCSNSFTIADICLAILLERLNQVGLSSRFWLEGKRPNIEKYYARVQERESYKKTIPGVLDFLKGVITPTMIGVSLVTFISLIVGVVFLAKHYLA